MHAYLAGYGWSLLAVALLAAAVFAVLLACHRLEREERRRDAEQARRRYQATVYPLSDRDNTGARYRGHVPPRSLPAPMPAPMPPRSAWGLPVEDEPPNAAAVAAAAALLSAASRQTRNESRP